MHASCGKKTPQRHKTHNVMNQKYKMRESMIIADLQNNVCISDSADDYGKFSEMFKLQVTCINYANRRYFKAQNRF